MPNPNPNPQAVAVSVWEAPRFRITMTPATNVSGWTLVLNIRSTVQPGTLLLQLTSPIMEDAGVGIFYFTASSAQLGALGAGDFDFDVWRIDTANEKRLVWGPLNLLTEQWK